MKQEDIDECLKLAIKACQKISEIQRNALMEKYQTNQIDDQVDKENQDG